MKAKELWFCNVCGKGRNRIYIFDSFGTIPEFSGWVSVGWAKWFWVLHICFKKQSWESVSGDLNGNVVICIIYE